MKYDPSVDYLFECEFLVSGLDSKHVDDVISGEIISLIEDKKIKVAVFSNESTDKSENMAKIFSILEELQCFSGGRILHIGRVPDEWKVDLVGEMNSKGELTESRRLHIDDCIMFLVEVNEKIKALILNRKSVYCISDNPPRRKR